MGTSQINTRSDILSSRRIWASFGQNLPGIPPKRSPSTLPIRNYWKSAVPAGRFEGAVELPAPCPVFSSSAVAEIAMQPATTRRGVSSVEFSSMRLFVGVCACWRSPSTPSSLPTLLRQRLQRSPPLSGKLLAERDRVSKQSQNLRGQGQFIEAIAATEKTLTIERQVFVCLSDEVAESLELIGRCHMARDEFRSRAQSIRGAAVSRIQAARQESLARDGCAVRRRTWKPAFD